MKNKSKFRSGRGAKRFGHQQQTPLQNVSLLKRAVALHQNGEMAEAESLYLQILKAAPNHFDGWHLLGVLRHQQGRHTEALGLIGAALKTNPNVPQALSNYGTVLDELKRYDEAVAAYDKALEIKPDDAETLYCRATTLNKLKRHEEALASYDKALAIRPQYVEALYNRGNALKDLNRYEEALASYDRALALRPDYAKALFNRGVTLQELKRYEEAIAAYDRAIALKPDYAEAFTNRGNALQELKRLDEALASYDEALALKPDYAEAFYNRGVALQELKRLDEALASNDKAIALKPDLAEAWNGRGSVFDKLKRHEEAAAAYVKVLEIESQHPFTKGLLLHQKMFVCEWKDINYLIEEIESDVAAGKLSAEPFGWQAVAKSEKSLQLCAKLYNEEYFPANINSAKRLRRYTDQKIRIGYLSGEFRNQATSHLLVGVLEDHDNTRFEIYAFDNGWDDHSETRQRINRSVHKVINISRLSDPSAVAAICDNQIDILVNLNGYFGEHRMRVFAQRPAPIQVNYLGFPGTLGASYIDYIIADQYVIPDDQRVFYTEKVIYLPNCYQANDRKKAIGTRIFSRLECGLPENGFVFCSFNNNYKIMPDIFDCWMRILKQVEGSVLWLLEDNASAAGNLKKEAVARGVSSERLVFAKRMPLPEHLARHKLADLFLDTLPCNAHTTASDALWAGLPVLTCLGQTLSGRVAASLLNAIHLSELITTTLEDYEGLAIELTMKPEKLAKIKRKLADNRLTTPLFDTKLFTKHIEAAYTTMYERHQAGLAPDHLIIPN